MIGTVTRLMLNKGFGFLRGSDGIPRFLHASECEPPELFDRLYEGQAVEFETADLRNGKGNGLRAVNVRVIESQRN